MSAICDRIDAALEKVALSGMEVRAIYLDKPDHQALTRWWTRHWRKELGSKATFHPLSYRDHLIRFGKRSKIYSTHCVETSIPKRLSPRVRQAA